MTEETLFHEALAKPLAERAAYLDKACAGQPELRAAVEALLAAHAASGDFLNKPPMVPDQPVDNAPGKAKSAPGEAPPDLGSTGAYHPRTEAGTVIAGRYALQEKIGEGGMGEVWVAKQTEPVKRKVALKLIKAGMDSRAVLTRFEQERQALAMMDHPHIARVHDGGLTPSGQPFFVMELVNGLPLNRFCDEARLTPKERLELFVPICQAVQHAHQKGIVHRDLKPANILVTLIDGRAIPKVIDFGVAKATGGKLTVDSVSTQFGAIVGTLEYMSPEQAGYSGVDVDTRADIYSLGVILYELLTGLRPIDAKRLKMAAFTEMIRILKEEEPAKPSTRLSTAESLPSLAALRQTEPRKLMALLRGELDWVVMKCLEKSRERRYETANALARDVQRYLADEAVEARPPSAGYRLSKFLKRNKGPVIAASLLLLALLSGIGGTTWGLIRADQAFAAEAKRVTERDTALGEATAASNELEKANTKLTESQGELLKSNDQLLSSAARSLLRPLAVQVRPEQPLPPLNDQEVEALWDLASSKDERLRLRFVEVALQDPVSTRRLKDRGTFALQAGVGLNATRRTQVEELLGKRLQAKEMSPEQQVDVALCLAHLGNLDRTQARTTAATLTQAMTRTTDPNALHYLSEGLSAVAARLEPKEAAQAYGQAAFTLTQAMSKTTDPYALEDLAQGLSAVAAGLEPKEASQACGQAAVPLIKALSKTTELNALWYLSGGLSAVAARLEPKEAAEAAVALTQTMSKTTEWNALHYLAQGLSAVAARLEPKEAAQACGQAAGTLTQAMSKTTDWHALQDLAQGLSAVAARLEPKEASQACGQAAVTLTQAMSRTTDPKALHYLSEGLSAVAAHLEPKEAAEAAVALTQTMSKTTEWNALHHLAQGLSAVASRLEPKAAAQACGQAAVTLTQAMSKTTDPSALHDLAQDLLAVAVRLEPKEAAQACGQAAGTLTQAMSKTTDPSGLGSLSQSLSSVAARLEPKEAAQAYAQAAATLTQATSKTSDANALGSLSRGLLAVAARMEPKAVAEVAATLTKAVMSKTTDPTDLWHLAQGLSAVMARLESKEAAQACAQAVATLTQTMSKTTDPNALESLSVVLSREPSTTPRDRYASATATVATLAGPGLPFAALAWAQLAPEPAPPPLPPQALVEILKQPFCVGEARRLVLEQLTRHHHRPFADQWEFVDYVHQHKLDLDLTTPPERPPGW